MRQNRIQAEPKRHGTVVAAVCLLAGALALTGCKGLNKETRQTYDGLYFPVKTKALDKKTRREVFIVQVSRAAQSVESAGKAAHHEGTKYCIANYGPHQIEWLVDPLGDPEALQVVKDTLTVQGTCIR